MFPIVLVELRRLVDVWMHVWLRFQVEIVFYSVIPLAHTWGIAVETSVRLANKEYGIQDVDCYYSRMLASLSHVYHLEDQENKKLMNTSG